MTKPGRGSHWLVFPSLPVLTGTAAQVVVAAEVRRERLEDLDERIDRALEGSMADVGSGAWFAAVRDLRDAYVVDHVGQGDVTKSNRERRRAAQTRWREAELSPEVLRGMLGRYAVALKVERARMASAAVAQSWISSALLTVMRARRAAAAETFGWAVYPALALGGDEAAAPAEPVDEEEEEEQWHAKTRRLPRVSLSTLPAWWVAAQWPTGELPLREYVLQAADWLGRGKPSSKRASFLARDLGMFGAGDVLKTGTSPRHRAATTGERTTFEQFLADIRRKLETKAEVWGPREHYAAHVEWRLTLARLIGDASAWRQAELAARRNTDGRAPGEGRLDARGQRFLRARLAFHAFRAQVKERREPPAVLEGDGEDSG